jgi:hypothetical protein
MLRSRDASVAASGGYQRVILSSQDRVHRDLSHDLDSAQPSNIRDPARNTVELSLTTTPRYDQIER